MNAFSAVSSVLSLEPEDLAAVNARLESATPEAILEWAVSAFAPDAILTCSFQHDGVVLGHMLTAVAPEVPIIFLETRYHFPETLAYKEEIVRRFGFNLKTAETTIARAAFEREHGSDLYARDPDRCCGIHKVAPLKAALEGVRCWINGRRRGQAATRSAITVVERFDGGMHKVNPMAAWTARDTHRYMQTHGIPEHPLFERGYASIGCAPCTRPILPGEDERAGRWAGRDKTECGIHAMLKPAS